MRSLVNSILHMFTIQLLILSSQISNEIRCPFLIRVYPNKSQDNQKFIADFNFAAFILFTKKCVCWIILLGVTDDEMLISITSFYLILGNKEVEGKQTGRNMINSINYFAIKQWTNIYDIRMASSNGQESQKQKWFCFKQTFGDDFDAIRRAPSAISSDPQFVDHFAVRYDSPSVQSEGFGDGYAFR